MGIRIGLRWPIRIHIYQMAGRETCWGIYFGLGNSEQSVLNKAVGRLSVRCDEVVVEV